MEAIPAGEYDGLNVTHGETGNLPPKEVQNPVSLDFAS